MRFFVCVYINVCIKTYFIYFNHSLCLVIVTFSPQLARMVLSHVKIGPSLWEALAKHTKPVDKSVRTTFIHFLMAFLVDGCVSVIWPLLEIKGKHMVILGTFENIF